MIQREASPGVLCWGHHTKYLQLQVNCKTGKGMWAAGRMPRLTYCCREIKPVRERYLPLQPCTRTGWRKRKLELNQRDVAIQKKESGRTWPRYWPKGAVEHLVIGEQQKVVTDGHKALQFPFLYHIPSCTHVPTLQEGDGSTLTPQTLGTH